MMTVKRPYILLISLVVLVLTGILLVRYQKTGTPTLAPSSLKSTPTNAPIQESKVHSPDGTIKLTMRLQKRSDGSQSYSFYVSEVDGKGERFLFSKTIGSTGTMALPRNSFSPDNKYVYVEEGEGDLLNALVFKASAELFANGKSFLDVAQHLAQSKPGYRLTHVTGWASPQFLQMDTLTEKLTKGPSFWFDVASRTFLLH